MMKQKEMIEIEEFQKVMKINQDILEANKVEKADLRLKQLFKVKSLNLDSDMYVVTQKKTNTL